MKDLTIPPSWVVLRFDNSPTPVYACFLGWEGDTSSTDQFKITPPIKSATVSDNYASFVLANGAELSRHHSDYGLNKATTKAWRELQFVHGDKVSIMPPFTAWDILEYVV